MPSVAVTSHSISGRAVVDREVQRYGAVTTIGIGANEGMVDNILRGVDVGSHREVGMLIPVEASANHCRGVTDSGVVNCKDERIIAVIVGTIASESKAMPCVAVASCHLCRGAVVDGKVQHQYAVATVNIAANEVMGVVARGGDAIMLVPVEAVTNLSDGVASVAAVDGEEQCIVTQGEIARTCERESMPCVAVASSNSVDIGRLAEVVGDEEVEGQDTIATHHVGAWESVADTLRIG